MTRRRAAIAFASSKQRGGADVDRLLAEHAATVSSPAGGGEGGRADPPDGPRHSPSPSPLGLDPAAAAVVAALLALRGRDGDHVWLGGLATSGRGVKTGHLAAYLRLRPGTPGRAAFNAALTGLRKLGLAHFEYDRLTDEQATWWLTPAGLDLAERGW